MICVFNFSFKSCAITVYGIAPAEVFVKYDNRCTLWAHFSRYSLVSSPWVCAGDPPSVLDVEFKVRLK